MEIPEWVKKYRQKGTAIEAHGGNYYLRRVSSKWDKEKQRARKISGEYLGKITRDGLIPPKREQVRKSLTSENITIREFGATQFILNCNEDIIELIKTHYPYSWKDILVFAIFRLMHNSPLKNMEFYYQTSFLSETIPEADVSERRIGDFIRTLGTQRGIVEKFLKHFVIGTEYVAVDLTHVFSLSENVISSTLGHNSKHEFMPQINLFILFSLDRMMPAYFRVVVGSVASVSSLKLSIKESGAKNVVIVGDKGFYSADNVKELELDKLKYVLPLKRDSSLIRYNIIKTGDKKSFDGFLRFEKRIIWYYEYTIINERKIIVFLDDKLHAEEEKDILTRIDESRSEDKEATSQKLAEFYENQYRLGTIAIITNLKDNAEKIFTILKSRIDIEQMYDIFKNTLHADRSYMRDDYQIEGWMFLNFISLLFYYKIYKVLVEKDILKKYSPMDVLTHLSRIHKLKIGDAWMLSETPKKTSLLLEKLESPITKNLRS
jgi:transposase